VSSAVCEWPKVNEQREDKASGPNKGKLQQMDEMRMRMRIRKRESEGSKKGAQTMARLPVQQSDEGHVNFHYKQKAKRLPLMRAKSFLP